MSNNKRRGLLIILSSPSGAGKSTLSRRLMKWDNSLSFSISSTTRSIRSGETNGKDVLFDIDWQGAQQISNSTLQEHVLSIFILPPSINELKSRLEKRGQDSSEIISKRMEKSWDEISHWAGYDYVLINDDLNETETRLKSIVTAERLRRSQQPNLMDHVRLLKTEFESKNDI